jgi:hypothetical protein
MITADPDIELKYFRSNVQSINDFVQKPHFLPSTSLKMIRLSLRCRAEESQYLLLTYPPLTLSLFS